MASETSAPLLFNTKAPKLEEHGQDSKIHGFQPSFNLSEVILEIKMLYTIAFPIIITGLLIYSKSLVSMLFLGRLGKEALAGGSLAIGIANITGYSVISGLAMGMEAISSQAFGAKQWPLMLLTLQRTIIILLFACITISLLWLNIEPILVLFDQDPAISSIASTYLTFCLPDLLFQSLICPLKIYLRSQNITLPLMCTAAISLVLHAPVNYFLVTRLNLGIKGIAISVVIADLNLFVTLMVYNCFWGVEQKPWLSSWSISSVQVFDQEWKSILNLAFPSCFSVCLEWWWYELMILLSGMLPNATEAIASMGILLQATSLLYLLPSALSSAATTRVGNELGANRPNKARASSQIALCCAILTSLIAMSFMVAVPDMWGRAFTEDEVIVKLVAVVMPVAGLCELGNCPQTTGCGVVRGCAKPTLGVLINLGSFYGVGLPLAVWMGFGMGFGLLGLWLGLLAAQTVCVVVTVWVLRGTDWAVEANRAQVLIGMEANHTTRIIELKSHSGII